ncbi:MAG TPA: glycosyltransferase family 87 protein [Chloroflexota bacterium]|nr:glycosyltransferase family 87 protein [Chloroflexota bacterium]
MAVAYWNGAVLDPLQFRGFPDYVTQMGGARRLLAGQLPYNPDIRVWTDVNLPPITLLLLFAPFTLLSELAGKLVYFTLNHAAFLVGVALLVVTARPPGAVMGPLLWTALLAALGLTFEPWHDSLRLGQQNGIVFLCLVLALVALCQRRDALAGVALAAAFIGKPSSALLGLYLLYAGRWRAIAAGAVCGLGLFAVTLPWTGVENWRYYLLEKAPQILAGTPQQSNVALLALHARLFLPREALSSFDAMPLVPAAQWMTRVAQVLGALALWGVTRRGRQRVAGAGAPGQGSDRLTVHLEFAVALVLSLSLVGHAWQSYVTWLILAFAPLADPRLWQALPPGPRRWVAVLAGGSYAALALHDVALYKVIGTTTPAAAAFASLPNVALLVLAFALAVLHAAGLTAGASRSGFRVPRSWLSRDSELGTGNAERRGQRGGPRR